MKSTPVIKSSGSSVKVLDMFSGIPLVKATDMDFQRAIDTIKASSQPAHVKAGLLTVAYASGEDYRDANFIVDSIEYIRAEAAAQVVRCHLALDERQISSEFDLRDLSPKYRAIYFAVYRFLAGENAEAIYRKDPLTCAMGWMVLDPAGISVILSRGGKGPKLVPQ